MIGRRFFPGLLAAALFTGCSVRPEQTLINDFFTASRLRDLTALAGISTVVFEPRERGFITTFTIRRISVERVEGDTRVKDVEITAPLRTPDGSTQDSHLVVRLQKRSGGDGRSEPAPLYGGWIITAVTDATPAAVPPS